jgi:hypothetical protein
MSLLAKALQPVATKIGKEVAESIAPKVGRAVDAFADWGWRGGKPGEITGTEFSKKGESLFQAATRTRSKADDASIAGRTADAKRLDRLAEKASKDLEKYDSKVIAQLDKAAASGKFSTNWEDIGYTMDSFKRLETLPLPNGKVGLPRKLTGKVMHAFGGSIPKSVKDDEIIRVAKEIDTMTPGQLDTMRVLANDWVGSVEDLLAAARSL